MPRTTHRMNHRRRYHAHEAEVARGALGDPPSPGWEQLRWCDGSTGWWSDAEWSTVSSGVRQECIMRSGVSYAVAPARRTEHKMGVTDEHTPPTPVSTLLANRLRGRNGSQPPRTMQVPVFSGSRTPRRKSGYDTAGTPTRIYMFVCADRQCAETRPQHAPGAKCTFVDSMSHMSSLFFDAS